MVDSSKGIIGGILQKSFIRIPLKLALWSIVFVVVAFAGVAACNALDEELSAEAKAMLALPPMGTIDDKNGFIAFLGMVAPKGQDQMEWGRKAAAAFTAQAQPGFARTPEWKEATRSHIKGPEARKVWKLWCTPESRDCLAEAKKEGDAVAGTLADEGNVELLARYRKVREAPGFSDLYLGTNPAASTPAYSSLTTAASLSLADSAVKAGAGDLEAVVAELEREVTFHRRVIAGGRSIIVPMIGNVMLARDLLAISELLRSGGEQLAPYHGRLRALTQPQISAAVLQPAFRFAIHEPAVFGLRSREMLRDNNGWMFSTSIEAIESPLRNWVLSLLVRTNETVNLIAAVSKIEAAIAGVPAAQFDLKAKEIRAAKDALLERPWFLEFRNPVGKGVAELVAPQLSNYAARMNDLQALERMVDLQAVLAEKGITDSAAIAAFVSGEGAKTHADPYTGKPFAFDAEKRLLSFEPREKNRWQGDLKKRYGKTGVAL